MKKLHSNCMKATVLGMTIALLLPVAGYAAEQQEAAPALKDDFYEAVNYEQLQQWEIPANQAIISPFYELGEQNDRRILQIVQEASENTEAEKGSDSYNIGALYLTGMDTEARDEGGYGEAAGIFLEEVDQAQTIGELIRSCLIFNRKYGFYSLLGFSYGTDGEDSSQKVLYLYGGDTGLSKEVWFSDEEGNKNQVEAFHTYVKELLKINGLSEEAAAQTEEKAAELMQNMASASLSLAEQYDAEKTYNVYQVSDIEELFSGLVTSGMIEEIYGVLPDEKMIVQDVGLIEEAASLMKKENLEDLKAYVKICLYRDLSQYSGMDSFEVQQTYNHTIYGLEEGEPLEKLILYSVQQHLGFECGRLFSENYFQEETKENIAFIIGQVREVFEKRLENLEWMSEETRGQAIEKLQALDVRIGYPDIWPQDSYELVLKRPEDGGLYVDNLLEIAKVTTEDIFETRNEPVDKSEWYAYPQEVNAYYEPTSNSITILAGILQEPFYHPDAEPVENLGKIGFIIGHEITHAFDISGSQFDAEGNIRNWWTDEDSEHFQELAQEVVDYYSSMEIDGIQLNGEQTLTENIADLGGFSCAMEIAENNGYDLKKFCESYASLWAEKYRPGYLSDLLANDTHAPGKIRANAVLSATDEFYEIYDITEDCKMYCAPEDRPKIW